MRRQERLVQELVQRGWIWKGNVLEAPEETMFLVRDAELQADLPFFRARMAGRRERILRWTGDPGLEVASHQSWMQSLRDVESLLEAMDVALAAPEDDASG